MTDQKLIIAGFGGQGVMFMGQLLAYSGMNEDKEVSWFPSYGPEMRGGTANCNVIISDNPIGSPMVTSPNSIIAMNRPSLDKFENKLEKDGMLFINSSLIDRKVERDDIEVIYIAASEIADKIGISKVANMIMVGAYIQKTGVVSFEIVEKLLSKVLTGSKAKFIPYNVEAMKKGAELAKLI